MDKVKEILVYKFWILTGIALLLPISGWWVATSGMKAAFAEQKAALDTSFGKASLQQPAPNKNWTTPLVALNQEEAKRVIETRLFLLNQQQSLMTWPDNIAEAMQQVPYRGEIGSVERQLYKQVYDNELYNIWKIMNPLDEGSEGPIGLVDFPLELLPSEHLGETFVLPTSEEMWNCQEDIWLLRSIVTALAAANLEAKTPLDTNVRQINLIELRGGSKTKPSAGGAAGPGGASAMPGSSAGPAAVAVAGPPAGMSGMGGPGNTKKIGASFDPAEEFGIDDAPGGAGPAGSGSAGASAPAMPLAMGNPGMGGGPGQPVKKRLRYVEDNEQFKTRGFYLELVIDHRYLPQLLAELSNMPWPSRIVRVHQVDHDISDVGGGMTAGGGMEGARRSMGPMGFGGASRMQREGDTPRPDHTAALANPFLVDCAISGLITLYKPPKETAPAPGTPAAPGAAPPSAVPAAAPPVAAAPAAEATASETAAAEKPAAESADAAPKPAAPAEPADKPAAEAPAKNDEKPKSDEPPQDGEKKEAGKPEAPAKPAGEQADGEKPEKPAAAPESSK